VRSIYMSRHREQFSLGAPVINCDSSETKKETRLAMSSGTLHNMINWNSLRAVLMYVTNPIFLRGDISVN
jgi:hypothetical protein